MPTNKERLDANNEKIKEALKNKILAIVEGDK